MTDQPTLIDLANQTNKVLQSSRQPKNNPLASEKTARAFISHIRQFVKKSEQNEPVYSPQSSPRDAWLRQLVKSEPHLAGTLSTAVSLDTNRGYSLVGGRNQVVRFSRVLRDVENGKGWRTLKQLGCQDYYSTDMGQVTENETDGRNGPLLSLYHVDAVRCELTGNPKTPLIYKPQNGKEQEWKAEYFYRIASLPNPDERFHQLGFCAVSRALKLAQVMVAIMDHNLEKLNTLLPNGILAVESDEITQEMWDQAFDEHQSVYTAKTGNEYYDRLITLVARSIKLDLTPFSQMPEKFDVFKWTDYMMRGYALCFNRDPRSFWSVSTGALGSSGESYVQAERATQSGMIDYLLADQEHLQRLLPASLLFHYEEDDTAAKLLKADLLNVWADAGIKLQTLGVPTDSVLALMVKEGIIDSEFTPAVEEVIATDDENVIQKSLRYRREKFLQQETVQTAVQRFADEPIVEYQWPNNKIVTLWERGSDAIKRHYVFNWVRKNKPKGSRQQQSILVKQQTEFDTFGKIVEKGLEKEIDSDELQQRLVNFQLAAMLVSYFNEATTEENRTAIEQNIYDNAVAFMDNDALLSDDPISDNEEVQSQLDAFDIVLLAVILPGVAYNRIIDKYEFGLESDFFEQIENGFFEDSPDGALENRIGLWEGGLVLAAGLGFLYLRGGEDELLIWQRGDTVKPCSDCVDLDQQIKPRSEWQSSSLLPQSGSLACGGINCQCRLVPVG